MTHSIFDFTANDVGQLSDTDLRVLVGRLCEAELARRGLPTAAVTWGGNQTAKDGGIDVRVALAPGSAIEGDIPRHSTGYQVKKGAMARAEILAEMRPRGRVRPAIQALADEGGAYIIVSSKGWTSDMPLQARQEAMREALDGVAHADKLFTDFYDRSRLATWARSHAGIVLWARERVGRSLAGWRPYGPWSGGAESVDSEYLLDDRLRLHICCQGKAEVKAVADSVDYLRDKLAQPGKIVRLVGLSGVGKTRLVQALFDERVGSRPLTPSLAVYTNLSDNPSPQPGGLASDLLAQCLRAVLIVDNCPPELHRRLSELCSVPASTVSVLTIEYDVREDQPEGTQVVRLDTSSPELIEKLVRRRYPYLSQVDARRVAEFSGGNARIAMCLAEAIEPSGSIAGLADNELFERLFYQRHAPDNALLRAAQACSLVYSFEGEALTGDEAELPRLACLVGLEPEEIYRQVSELLRRALAQRRGVWRAVLPDAIANRLAARALEDTPGDVIEQQLVRQGTARLARSFSRRLSCLHEQSHAVAIVKRWLAPGGLLGDAATLDDLGRAMFENVASVLPEMALAALERVGDRHPHLAINVWRRHLRLLRALAYDSALFERSARLLARAATESEVHPDGNQASAALVSLFSLYLSGTHATVEQRLSAVEDLLTSGEARRRALGLAALDRLLTAEHFDSNFEFEFGARSRDYGFHPRTVDERARWYSAALSLIERVAANHEPLKLGLRELLAQRFRELWRLSPIQGDLERIMRLFADVGFWREGWAACWQTLGFEKKRLTPEATSQLLALEADLAPSNLQEQVRAVVLGKETPWPDLEGFDVDCDFKSADQRSQAAAQELGAAVATHHDVFEVLLPDLLRGGSGTWQFGAGLAAAAPDRGATWRRLVEGLDSLAPEQRNVQVLGGFLAELWAQDRDLAKQFLDAAADHPALVEFLPLLYSAVGLDEHGARQLMWALTAGKVPARACRSLAFGQATAHLAGDVLAELVLLIADQPGGYGAAVDILSMRLSSDSNAQRGHQREIVECGRQLLQRVKFRGAVRNEDYRLARVVRACLAGQDAAPVAAEVTARLRQAEAAYETSPYDSLQLLSALLKVQPSAVLSVLFLGSEAEQEAARRMFETLSDHPSSPADVISSEALIAWCDGDAERHYPFAASLITFARRPEAGAPLAWTAQAEALLASGPDPRTVLEVLIDRLRPMSWSGSLASEMEQNAPLLASLLANVPTGLVSFVKEAQVKLEKDIAQQRQRETEQDQASNERFE